MKTVIATETPLTSKVRAAFQHHNGHTAVLHKEDNLLYLYELTHMRPIGKSKVMLCSPVQLLAFSNDLNIFYAVCKETNRARQLIAFELNESEELVSHSMEFRKSNTVIQPQYLCMAVIGVKEERKDDDGLICLDAKSYSIYNKTGRQQRQESLLFEGEGIRANKIYHMKGEKFAICSEKNLFIANIGYQSYEVRLQQRFQERIRELFLDSFKKYMAVQTEDHIVHIITFSSTRSRICYQFITPFSNICHACFFTPGINTSATNKFKDRLYLIFQVVYDDRDRAKEKTVSNYNSNNLYAYEFRESSPGKNHQFPGFKAFGQFCTQGVGKIFSLLFNSLDYNSVLALHAQGRYVSYNLVHLLSPKRVDHEWIYLSYKFQRTVNSFRYEEREDEFQNELFRRRQREIKEEELNDWSSSALTPLEIQNSKKNRIKCLNF